LTARQKAVWDFLRAALIDTGRLPTLRELSRQFDMRVSAAHFYVRTMVRKGYLRCERHPGKVTTYLPAKPELIVLPASPGRIRLATIGGPVSLGADDLRALLAKGGAR
jgi:hypothetical protein